MRGFTVYCLDIDREHFEFPGVRIVEMAGGVIEVHIPRQDVGWLPPDEPILMEAMEAGFSWYGHCGGGTPEDPAFVFANDGTDYAHAMRFGDTHLPAVPVERNGQPSLEYMEWARDYIEILGRAEEEMSG